MGKGIRYTDEFKQEAGVAIITTLDNMTRDAVLKYQRLG